MHTRHKHASSAWRNTHTSHTRTHTAPRVTILPENTTSITSLTQTFNILQHSKTRNIIFNNGRYTTNIPPHSHYNSHKNKHALCSSHSVVGKRARLGNFERAGWGFNPHCGQKVKSEKSECNNSGYKLTWWPWRTGEVLIRDSWD